MKSLFTSLFYNILAWSTRNKTSPLISPVNLEIKDHRLTAAKQLVYPAGPPMGIRRFLVIHFTAGASALSSYKFWTTGAAKGAEAHLIIDRDGTIYQVRRFDQKSDHAGASQWRDPKTGILYTGLNGCSIGIELANAGDSPIKWAREQPGFRAVRLKHKNGGPEREWEVYPDAQLEALERVSKALVAFYKLDDLIGHDDIAPDRKSDPGPAFPMEALRQACGFKGMPVKLRV